MQLLITGHTGFVGQNLVRNFGNDFTLRFWDRHSVFHVSDADEAVIHLAGKAHDLKAVSDPDEYYQVNTELTKQVFDAFLRSPARVFIVLSSVKAVADAVDGILDEGHPADPATHYGNSKKMAEEYISAIDWPADKRVYILRPCMIHGPGNKGNLNLLYQLVQKGVPWPLGSFDNQRSFLGIDNLIFVIRQLLTRTDIPSGIYHIADDDPLSTNALIRLMAATLHRPIRIWRLPKGLVSTVAKAGDTLHLPLNTEKLQKLTESYVVSNRKLLQAIGKPLPVSVEEGLRKTIRSFAGDVRHVERSELKTPTEASGTSPD
jgi:nucleoside-diphosphate-sugar epimerase